MFWEKKSNTSKTVQEPVNPLYLFELKRGYTNLSGISIEPVLQNEEISQRVIYIFEGINDYYSEAIQNFWRHAFIYHHDLPSSVSLATIRERCYQHPKELETFIEAVREYKRATFTQENIEERLRDLKEAKKNLLVVVV